MYPLCDSYEIVRICRYFYVQFKFSIWLHLLKGFGFYRGFIFGVYVSTNISLWCNALLIRLFSLALCYSLLVYTGFPRLLFRPHYSTGRHRAGPIVTDRVAWSVCRSVCHTSEPCKNGWTDRDAFGLRTLLAPRNHVFGGVHIPMGTDNFRRKVRPIVKYRDTLRSSVQKPLNRWRCCLSFELG